jgi:hypothetical protein
MVVARPVASAIPLKNDGIAVICRVFVQSLAPLTFPDEALTIVGLGGAQAPERRDTYAQYRGCIEGANAARTPDNFLVYSLLRKFRV